MLPTLTATTEGGGTVVIDPPAGAYFTNGTATITATAAPGWRFLQWMGDVTGTNSTVDVTVDRDKYTQAIFGTVLSNTIVGSGSVIRSPASTVVPYGTQVRMTAVPQTGNYFLLWGNAGNGTNNPLTLAITSAAPTAAVFASLSGSGTHALTVVATGNGSVSSSPYANRYTNGANVTLTAIPDAGQDFLGWGGAASGSASPVTVSMNQSKVVTATFSAKPSLRVSLATVEGANQGVRLTLKGEVGIAYRIDDSKDFDEWTPVTILTNMLGIVQFDEPVGTNSYRFFRASPLP